ncbi:MAG: DNA polymerase III subunit alpha [Actinomycetota bacterium]|nr:DNA polymerase III subunit alpha [Actinomycetota bacterium]
MEKGKFVHLHVHSEYSLLDGASRIPKLIERACDFNMPAVALTDHGVMYGCIEFYNQAKKAGIKPIIGCEVYMAPKSRWDKQSERDKREENFYHLTLLAENNHGYKNLMKIVSLGFLEGFYYKPRVDKELLKELGDGIIALSGCISGEIPKHIVSGRIKEAERILGEYLEIFGKDRFFLELQDSGIPEQKIVNRALLDLSEKYNIPLVATNDVHYIDKSDSKAHDVLLCIQTGSTINESGRLKFPTEEYYFKDYNQMRELFKDFPGALENTLEIAERCNLNLKFNMNLIPSFNVPDNLTADEYLKKLCYENIEKKYGSVTGPIEERLNRELSVIEKRGFSDYFLIVWDLVNFAREKNIRVGPGRGSAAGSIVSYLLGITSIEPLKYGLLFERFLNEERDSMPDIDIDFCYEKRSEIIKYVTDKYGDRKVAQLITFGTMAARQAIRDAGRVMEMPYAEVDRIAKMVPMELNMTIKNSLEINPELNEIYKNNEKVKEIIDTAISLEGISRQDSIHAAGVVISSEELYNYTPLQKENESDIVTQYKMEDIQKIGLLKMDFLGLKTLSLIDKTLFLIKKTKNIELDIDNVNLDDERTFNMLSDGECLGVFQLESSGMRELVMNLKPTKFEDLIALLALYRPGPLQSGMVQDFVESKNGRKQIEYLHPSLEKILESTYGIILYQEQVMGIASELAGFSMSEADILRSAISKKKRALLSKQKNKFIEGARKKGIDEKTSIKIFELVNNFAEYGFNKSHSAAYAMISYQTAYLKANYPVEFMAALLSIRMGSQEKVAQYVSETKRMGIRVLPPDINESYSDFTVVGNSIRFGLSAIKNVGTNVIESIEKERKKNGKFKNFIDFCERVDSSVLNKKTIESLIKSGTFDSMGLSRKYLLENYEKIIEEVLKIRKDRDLGQYSLFEVNGSDKEELMPGSSFQMEDRFKEFSRKELLNFEKEMLGLYISGHPLFEYRDSLSVITPVEALGELDDGVNVTVGGIITRVKIIYTKKDQQMCFVELEDVSDSVEVITFPSVFLKFREIIEEDKVVKIKGRLDKKEDQIKLIASEFEEMLKDKKPDESQEEITGISEERRRVVFKVKKDDIDKDFINHFYDLIKKYPGTKEVEFRITGKNGKDVEKIYNLPMDYRIDLNKSLEKNLREMFSDKISWDVV